MKPGYYIECGYDGRKCRIEFDFVDPDLDSWEECFKTILTFLTFSPEIFKEVFCSEST